MKFTFVGLTAIAIVAHTVLAACPCKAGDVSCFNKCVLDTNDCITNCAGDVKCYQNCIDSSWPGVEPATTSSATRETITESTTFAPSSLATVVPIPTSLISETALPSAVTGSSLSSMVGSIAPTSTMNGFSSRVSSAASEVASEMASLSASAAEQATSAIESSAEQATSVMAPGSAVTTQTPEEVIENTGPHMIPALGLTVLSVALTMFGF